MSLAKWTFRFVWLCILVWTIFTAIRIISDSDSPDMLRFYVASCVVAIGVSTAALFFSFANREWSKHRWW